MKNSVDTDAPDAPRDPRREDRRRLFRAVGVGAAGAGARTRRGGADLRAAVRGRHGHGAKRSRRVPGMARPRRHPVGPDTCAAAARAAGRFRGRGAGQARARGDPPGLRPEREGALRRPGLGHARQVASGGGAVRHRPRQLLQLRHLRPDPRQRQGSGGLHRPAERDAPLVLRARGPCRQARADRKAHGHQRGRCPGHGRRLQRRPGEVDGGLPHPVRNLQPTGDATGSRWHAGTAARDPRDQHPDRRRGRCVAVAPKARHGGRWLLVRHRPLLPQHRALPDWRGADRDLREHLVASGRSALRGGRADRVLQSALPIAHGRQLPRQLRRPRRQVPAAEPGNGWRSTCPTPTSTRGRP